MLATNAFWLTSACIVTMLFSGLVDDTKLLIGSLGSGNSSHDHDYDHTSSASASASASSSSDGRLHTTKRGEPVVVRMNSYTGNNSSFSNTEPPSPSPSSASRGTGIIEHILDILDGPNDNIDNECLRRGPYTSTPTSTSPAFSIKYHFLWLDTKLLTKARHQTSGFNGKAITNLRDQLTTHSRIHLDSVSITQRNMFARSSEKQSLFRMIAPHALHQTVDVLLLTDNSSVALIKSIQWNDETVRACVTGRSRRIAAAMTMNGLCQGRTWTGGGDQEETGGDDDSYEEWTLWVRDMELKRMLCAWDHVILNP